MARLKGQAAVCNFSAKCVSDSCGKNIDYSEKMVCHQLVRGLSDPTIQEQTLAHAADIKDLDLATTVKFIEAKESGKRSSGMLSSSGGLNRIQAGRKMKPGDVQIQDKQQFQDKGKCGWCGQVGHGSRSAVKVRREKCRSFDHVCEQCGFVGHFELMCRSKKKAKPDLGAISEEIGNGNFCRLEIKGWGKNRIKCLPHFAYDNYSGWAARKPEPHPELVLEASMCREGYIQSGVPIPKSKLRAVDVKSLPDTGAQLTVAGVKLIHSMGITKSELIPLANGVNAANNAGLGLLGGAFITFSGNNGFGERKQTKQLVYIANDVNGVYLSRAACVELGLIGKDFPAVGSHNNQNENQLGLINYENKDFSNYPVVSNLNGDINSKSCDCPKRQLPPPVPTELPFPAIPENRGKLEKWILEKYAPSAFNQCEHQPLPLISGVPPIKLHIDSNAPPVAIHKPRPVPIHWRKQVLAELERDVRIGVLERVPIGEPTTWCSPMVICPKSDGNPRRTVDLQALNKVAVRQTHVSEPPFHQALAVPKNKIKTVVDAWQGYHSVPIAEEDRPFTTFLTPWGKFRYKTCPQGFLASGDAYNARYDKIIEEFTNKTKCIDDTLLWSDDLEGSFYRTCEYLTLCSNAGIIFNKKKFQFGQEEVEFLGFRIGMDSIRPSIEYLKAITDCPRPRDITGVRSWFGLVQQVAYAFSNSDLMSPFRLLLKPSTEFAWSQEL